MTVKKTATAVIGVISDTHGELSPEAARALAGVNCIVHAGDIVGDHVIRDLSRISEVVAVRGNMDRYGRAGTLPGTAVADVGGISLYVLHDLFDLDIDPAAAGVSVVVHGHTHRAEITWKRGVLYINPGSARPRGQDGATVGRITISGGDISPEILKLFPVR